MTYFTCDHNCFSSSFFALQLLDQRSLKTEGTCLYLFLCFVNHSAKAQH